jgi:hypothetical protein
LTVRQGYPFTDGVPGSDAEYSFLTGPPSIALEAAMITPLPSVVPAVASSARRLTQEIFGATAATEGRSKVGDAWSARYVCNCDIVALKLEEDAADELNDAADSEDEDELAAAEELAESEELELLEDAEELDCWVGVLSLPDACPTGPLESVLVAPHAATSAEPADKPANRRKSRRS